MQFNPGNGQGIVDDIDFLIGTNTSSYSLANKTRNINNRLDVVVSMIMMADGKWEYDDDNHTDLPVGTTDLVNGQDNYEIAAADFLDILRVELKQPNGTSLWLLPIDYDELRGTAMTEFQKTNGIPRYYDKVGSSIVLYPTPNYTYDEGLKVYYKRNAVQFDAADTTEEPGFNRQYHRLLSIGAGIDYCIPNGLDKKLIVLNKLWNDMSEGLINFYSARSKDKKVSLQPRKENYGVGLDMGEPSVDWSSR